MSTSPALPFGSPLVLASGSPRRRELLTRAGIALEVLPAHTEEAKCPGETPRQEIERLAEEKARAVAEQLGPEPARVVLGSDTGVVLDDEVLVKPEDGEHAVRLLQKLSGRTHAVITAVAIVRSDNMEVNCFSVETEVVFRSLGEEEIRAYVAGGEPMDKAGAYAIQGEGRRFIASTRGSESNVIGLPVEETLQALARYGIGANKGGAGTVSPAVAIAARIDAVLHRIAEAALRAGRRPEDVRLIAVSKTKSADAIAHAFDAGQREFGESYIQEAVAKIPEMERQLESASRAAPGDAAPDDATPGGQGRPRWHFIGRLQRNKAKDVVRHFDCFHALDRENLADALEKRAAAEGRTLDVLLQVNLGQEEQKGGIAPEALDALVRKVDALPHLRTIGLMTVPPASEDPEAKRPLFAALRELRDRLRDVEGFDEIRELSMGMSGDFEIAVEEGASMVRVGTAIFGPRE